MLVVFTISCGSPARLSVLEGSGPAPRLPAPRRSLIPVIKVSPARGWPADAKPEAAPGTQVQAFARDLDHPRWLYVLPNGDVLVAETNAPADRKQDKGIKAWFTRHYLKKGGGAVPTANRITLLRDVNGDGVADVRTPFLVNLDSPFGMALVGDRLYVANTDALVRFHYATGDTLLRMAPDVVAPLPAGELNHHWTKSILPSADGKYMFVGVGSNSNVAEKGMAVEQERAAIWKVDLSTGFHELYATGLRNPVGMTFDANGGLWVAVNERDELGSDVPPDYMTRVIERAFYGWPYSYYGSNVDSRAQPERPDLVAKAVEPDFALGPHTASLGLAYAGATSLGGGFQHGMFVGQHGSWNRKPRSGNKVIFVPFQAGKPSGLPRDVLTGFLAENGNAYGRPVGVVLDKNGALLVADDVGNTIWRVTGISK